MKTPSWKSCILGGWMNCRWCWLTAAWGTAFRATKSSMMEKESLACIKAESLFLDTSAPSSCEEIWLAMAMRHDPQVFAMPHYPLSNPHTQPSPVKLVQWASLIGTAFLQLCLAQTEHKQKQKKEGVQERVKAKGERKKKEIKEEICIITTVAVEHAPSQPLLHHLITPLQPHVLSLYSL